MDINLDNYREFGKILDQVLKGNPLQKTSINKFLTAEASQDYLIFAERISYVFNHLIFKDDQSWLRAIDAYQKTCKEILKEQIAFQKTGTYRYSRLSDVRETVYEDNEKMNDYMFGLLLSYLFWPNQYKILEFYKKAVQKRRPSICLEVGPGHGLFTYFCQELSNAHIDLVDISQESLKVTEQILKAFKINENSIDYRCTDFLNCNIRGEKYELITMGEVIEHVETPGEFLLKGRDLLSDGGGIFLSTCVNSPAPDHIYQFHTVDEIRELIIGSGLIVQEELVLPVVADVPQQCWEKELIGINYAALLKK